MNLDDALCDEAQRFTRVTGRAALVHEALLAVIQSESAKRLARLGDTGPESTPITRRRSEPTGFGSMRPLGAYRCLWRRRVDDG